jgi:hypothetical protein
VTNPRRKTTVRPIRAKTPPTVATAAASGDERQLLIALRDEIAQAISDGCAARDLGTLSRRLLEVTRELADLDARREQEQPVKRRGARAAADEAWTEL